MEENQNQNADDELFPVPGSQSNPVKALMIGLVLVALIGGGGVYGYKFITKQNDAVVDNSQATTPETDITTEVKTAETQVTVEDNSGLETQASIMTKIPR